jgi:hypothetical protein
LARGPFKRPVKGAEGAVFRAEIGVIDVAIDDVGDHALGVKAAANRVCLHAKADQIVGLKVIEGFCAEIAIALL